MTSGIRTIAKAANAICTRLENRIKKLEAALRPFASISLERDENPNALDMISGPDLAVTPGDVRRARNILGMVKETRK